MLSQIQLMCPFEACGIIVDYDNFAAHKETCKYNPDMNESCVGCDELFNKQTLDQHEYGCIKYLRYQLSQLQLQLFELNTDRNCMLSKTNLLEVDLTRIKAERDYHDINKVS